ncbi:putative glycolipid-binding domain-containing protein [Mesorhizobium sp. M1406]|uniref:putative glycolipid-binding domain-containing protein n=1 Tax=Mesorhizobium sp. M1406 TaxID=2957099 RepID=UPI00333898D5
MLSETGSGRGLKGQAIFVQDGKPCCLAYEVDCDAGWSTRAARVDGFRGTRKLHYAIERGSDGLWTSSAASG